jgi:putative transcriptional regulator
MLADRKMHSKELAETIGTTPVNISRIRTGQVRGIRFSTLNEICKTLNCQPGDLLEFVADAEEELDDAAD